MRPDMRLTDENSLIVDGRARVKLLEAQYWLEQEIYQAREKFPQNEHMMAALAEEFGELGEALLKQKGDWRHEAIQVACVALRIATEGDADYPFTQEEPDGK